MSLILIAFYSFRLLKNVIGLKTSDEKFDEIDQVNKTLPWKSEDEMKKIVELYSEFLKGDEFAIKIKLVEIFKNIGNIRAVELLIERLKDADPKVIVFSAKALREIGDI